MLNRLSQIKHQGFTLLELIIVVAIAAILVGIVIPGFSNLIANNKLTVSANELVADIHLARSEAVTREVPVSVCASEDGESCSRDSEWGRGWIVFTDASGTSGVFDSSDELIFINKIEGDSIRIAAANSYVRFSSMARAIK